MRKKHVFDLICDQPIILFDHFQLIAKPFLFVQGLITKEIKTSHTNKVIQSPLGWVIGWLPVYVVYNYLLTI